MKQYGIIAKKINDITIKHEFFIMEYFKMNLNDLIKKLRKEKIILKIDQKIEILKKIALNIKFFHDIYYIHGDLKPKNILLNKSYNNIKICDYGLTFLNKNKFTSSKSYEIFLKYKEDLLKCKSNKDKNIEDLKKKFEDFFIIDQLVTLRYRAPEILFYKFNSYEKIDIWSFGCIMFELLYEKKIFSIKKFKNESCYIMLVLYSNFFGFNWCEEFFFSPFITQKTKKYILKKIDQKNKNHIPIVKKKKYENINELILKCLNKNFLERPTINEILNHSFFNKNKIK